MPSPKSIRDRAERVSEADRRQWTEAANLVDELDEFTEPAQAFVDAVESLRSAVEDKENASDMTGEERSDALQNAWDQVVEALTQIVESADKLGELVQ